MRKIGKGDKPEILSQNEVAWTIELLSATPGTAEFKQIERRYGHVDIRARLGEETHHKCAYCESHIEAIAFPHIEHIKPKSGHRELTFAWDNLTLACPACNTNKGTTEPTARNFVHPYVDEPEKRFDFVGSLIAPAPDDLTAKNMINWLDLNRSALVISRSEIAMRVHDIFLEAIRLPEVVRREFLSLSIGRLASPESRHSRVAECMARICEWMYQGQLKK